MCILYSVFISISVEAFILSLCVYRTVGTPYTAYYLTVREMPLNDLNIGVVCAFSTWRVMELIFLNGSTSSNHHVRLILTPFVDHLTEDKEICGRFVQSNATACTSDNFMNVTLLFWLRTRKSRIVTCLLV